MYVCMMQYYSVHTCTLTCAAVGRLLGSHCNMSPITLIPSALACGTRVTKGVGTITTNLTFMELASLIPSGHVN